MRSSQNFVFVASMLALSGSAVTDAYAFPDLSMATATNNIRKLLTTMWPAYSQQCQDDAGPPFADDTAIFGPGGHYSDQSQAIAVLQNGDCAGPIKAACDSKRGGGVLTPEIARISYLEGPIDCGGKGWFCRILPDPNWDGGVQNDWNFNHCNRTDYGDVDGHCHGSDNDDVFYWWARDHWFRNYAGRLHCCCDWKAVENVVARCDYRAPLKPGEWEECRDANEDHNGPGSGFSKGYEAGCSNLGTTLPLPEPEEGQCWDVLNYAPGNDEVNTGNLPTQGGSEEEEENGNEGEGEEEEENENEGEGEGEEEEENGNEGEGEEEEENGNEGEGEEEEENGNEGEGEEEEENGNEGEGEEEGEEEYECEDSEEFDAGFGDCDTYRKGSDNHNYCRTDVDRKTGDLASEACARACETCETETQCVDSEEFNSGYGDCDTYREGSENHTYCRLDVDRKTGQLAFQACPRACGTCEEDGGDNTNGESEDDEDDEEEEGEDKEH